MVELAEESIVKTIDLLIKKVKVNKNMKAMKRMATMPRRFRKIYLHDIEIALKNGARENWEKMLL